jgi:hypothetical protein
VDGEVRSACVRRTVCASAGSRTFVRLSFRETEMRLVAAVAPTIYRPKLTPKDEKTPMKAAHEKTARDQSPSSPPTFLTQGERP